MRRPGPGAIVAAIALACGGEPADPPPETVVTDSAGIRIVTLGWDPDALPRLEVSDSPVFSVGGVEQREPLLEVVRSARWLSDGGVVVGDDQSGRLHVFDANGTHRSTFGGKGQGPGEFVWFRTLDVGSADTVVAYDIRLGRLSFVHPREGFVRSVGFDQRAEAYPLDVWATHHGLLTYRSEYLQPVGGGPIRRIPMDARLSAHERGADSSVASVSFRDSYFGVMGDGQDFGPAFAPRPVVAVADSVVAYGEGSRWEVVLADVRLHPRSILRWPGRRIPIRDGEVERTRDSMMATLPDAPFKERIVAAFLDERLLPAFRPTIGELLLDDRGRLWVGRYEPGRAPSRSWEVLSRDGEPIGRLEIPAGRRMGDVRGETILLVGVDTFGVPVIEAFDVRGL